MGSLHESMVEYRKQLQKGKIQVAYRGLMAYISDLRIYFKNKYPDFFTSGSLYYGLMDVTYFAIAPATLKQRGLKTVILFFHETCRFEVWLCGYNKNFQTKYWKLFKESHWEKYPLVPSPKGYDSILEHILIAEPDFRDLEAMTEQIEQGTLVFLHEVEEFLSTREN